MYSPKIIKKNQYANIGLISYSHWYNVRPKVIISYFDGAKQVSLPPIFVTESSCPGQKFTTNITIPSNALNGTSTINSTISINLDQSGLGDGNDLAIDNISLIKLNKLPTGSLLISPSNINTNILNTTDYTVSVGVTSNPPLPAGSAIWWGVVELDNNNNEVPGTKVESPTSTWWNIPGTFPGYNGTSVVSGTSPGIFKFHKTYKVVFGTWGECFAWTAASYNLRLDPNTRRAILTLNNQNIEKPETERLSKRVNNGL